MSCQYVVEDIVATPIEPEYIGAASRLFPSVLGAFALAITLALPLQYFYHQRQYHATAVTATPDAQVNSKLTDKEIKRLMRYHGVLGLRINADGAYIKRNKRWICVFHNPPTPAEG